MNELSSNIRRLMHISGDADSAPYRNLMKKADELAESLRKISHAAEETADDVADICRSISAMAEEHIEYMRHLDTDEHQS